MFVLQMLVVAACFGTTAPASAAEGTAQTPPAAADANPKRPDTHPECLAWTDGCINCQRGKTGEAFTCSNIGIACQPKEVVCTNRANPDAPKE